MPLPSRSSPPLWLLLNVLSLDAPLVAVAWQALLSSVSSTALRPAGRIILFLTVWLIYIVDRLLDVRLPARLSEPTRHRFYREHGPAMRRGALAIFALDATLILFELHPAVFRAGLITFAGVCIYFVLVHGTRVQFSKEIAVAALFTVGTFLVAYARAGQGLLLPALALFLLCLANLVAIEYGEGGRGPVVRRLGRWYLLWVPALVLLPIVVPGRWSHAISLAAAALTLLHLLRSRLSVDAHRVWVDVALLLPPIWFLN